MATRKPSVVLIPGSYCPAFFYYDLRDLLNQAGYDIHLHDLPSTSRAPGLSPASLSDDGLYFHSIIKSLADQGKDVIVIGHSYGGMVLRESIHNLSRNHRQRAKLPGGIARLVYISPILLEAGENGASSIDRHSDVLTFPSANIVEPVDPETAGGAQYLRQIPVRAWKFYFSDLGMEEGIKWTTRMTMHSMTAWTTPATALPEDEKAISITHVKCLQDEIFPLKFQTRMIKLLESDGGQVEIKEIDSGHCPNASCPDKLAALLTEVMR